MRHPISGTCRDTTTGQVRGSSTINVYLSGGNIPVSIYTASTGGTAVNSVTSDSLGKFLFYIDEDDYPLTQLFRIVSSKTGYDSITYDYIPFFSLQCVDTDVALSSNSDKKVPTQRAVKEYIDAVTAAITLSSGSLPAATAENDLILADASLNWVKKTLAETQSILELDSYILKSILTENTILAATVAGTPDNLSISNILDFIGSTAEGDTIYRGVSIWERLAAGSANQKKFMNAAGTAPEWSFGFYLGSFSRSMTASSGDVSYTGVGFKPSVIIFLSVLTTVSMSIGFDDGSSSYVVLDYNSSGNSHAQSTTPKSIWLWYSAGNYQAMKVKTMDVDGFTGTWTKTGSPTGTGIIYYLALR